MDPDGKIDAGALAGVSETALLTLNGRAYQARHPQAIIDDPMAIKLVDAIDFDFAKFGRRKGQEMALRSLAFDRATTGYLTRHPSATVIAVQRRDRPLGPEAAPRTGDEPDFLTHARINARWIAHHASRRRAHTQRSASCLIRSAV